MGAGNAPDIHHGQRGRPERRAAVSGPRQVASNRDASKTRDKPSADPRATHLRAATAGSGNRGERAGAQCPGCAFAMAAFCSGDASTWYLACHSLYGMP